MEYTSIGRSGNEGRLREKESVQGSELNEKRGKET